MARRCVATRLAGGGRPATAGFLGDPGFLGDRGAATALEYALVGSGIAVAVLLAILTMGDSMEAYFEAIRESFASLPG